LFLERGINSSLQLGRRSQLVSLLHVYNVHRPWLSNVYRENRNVRKMLDSGRLTGMRNGLRAAEMRSQRIRRYNSPGSLSGSTSIPLSPGRYHSDTGSPMSARSAPLPQFAHHHYFGWSDAYIPQSRPEARRRDGFALQSCNNIAPALHSIKACPTSPARQQHTALNSSCANRSGCALSMLPLS